MEGVPVPFGLPEQTVARGARRLVHNGKTFADQAIESSTFSYVGSANKCDNGFGHRLSRFQRRPSHTCTCAYGTSAGESAVGGGKSKLWAWCCGRCGGNG